MIFLQFVGGKEKLLKSVFDAQSNEAARLLKSKQNIFLTFDLPSGEQLLHCEITVKDLKLSLQCSNLLEIWYFYV